MARRGRHDKNEKNEKNREIVDLSEYREEKDPEEQEASIEYGEEDDPEEEERRLQRMRLPRAAYRVALILLLLVLGLAWWVNRETLTPGNIAQWARLQLMGSGEGDGFPVALTGSQVMASNFTARGGNVLVLSDTAYTMVDSSGKELLSLRHSLNRPAMRTAGTRTLLYNAGSSGYLVLSGTETVVDAAAEREILCGAVAQNGRFALGLQSADGASELQVCQEDGSLQFRYLFAEDYITAIALNYDGSYGAVCTVRTEMGELISRVTVFYFNEAEPLARYETEDNVLLDAYWSDAGDIYAVGESALLRARSPEYSFTETGYEGRKPTAYRLDQGRAFLSLSAYEHAGPCTLLIFRGREEPIQVESDQRIVALSASGSTAGALVNGQARLYDAGTGQELARVPVSADAKSIAMLNERTACTLGVSELRLAEFEGG